MICDTNILNKVRNYAALKYDAPTIAILLGLDDEQKQIFFMEFEDTSTNVFKFYRQGIEIGQYNVDAELAKQAEKGNVECITKLEERQQNRQVNNHLSEMFSL